MLREEATNDRSENGRDAERHAKESRVSRPFSQWHERHQDHETARKDASRSSSSNSPANDEGGRVRGSATESRANLEDNNRDDIRPLS